MNNQRNLHKQLIKELKDYIHFWKDAKLRNSLLSEITYQNTLARDWREEIDEEYLRREYEYGDGCYPCHLGICQQHS